MKIYTKKGDKGKTQLLGGTMVDKFNYKIEAYGNIDELKNESADLLYHLLVLLQRSETDISQVVKVLEQRHK
mgnify:CR=1 FL=1